MFEVDFTTEEGKQEARKKIQEMLEKGDKEEISKFLFSMLEFIVQHEIMFNNLKNI